MNLFLVPGRVLRLLALTMIVSLATGISGALPADTHRFGLDDYSALRHAHAVSVSPDGKTILYVVSHDGDKGPPKDEWRLIEVSGENSRKLELPGNFKPAGFLKDVGGSESPSDFWMERRRLHDCVDGHANAPLQSGH